MEFIFYTLKCGSEYLRFPTIGGGSVHLTSQVNNAGRFYKKEAAIRFIQTLSTNSGDYEIDSNINLSDIYAVKISVPYTEEKIY